MVSFLHVHIVGCACPACECHTAHSLISVLDLSRHDLIGQERYLHQADKANQNAPTSPQSHSFTQPTPIGSQTTQHSSLVATYTPFYVPESPSLASDPVRKPGHRPSPEAVCLTPSRPNGHSLSNTTIAERRRVLEGSQSSEQSITPMTHVAM